MISTALDTIPAPPCSKLVGWRLLDAQPEAGWIRIGFDGKPEFLNPAGLIQGGILSAMLDDTMGPAVLVKTNGRLYTATISMNVSFVAPAKVGVIIGEATVVQLGRTVAFIEGKLMDEAGGPARDRHGECAAGGSPKGNYLGHVVSNHSVMHGLVPRIHVFVAAEGVDGRDKHGHDAESAPTSAESALSGAKACVIVRVRQRELHGKGSARRVQRWGDRHHHHHHGA